MKVVAINRLTEAQIKYPAAAKSLGGWYQVLSNGSFASEADLQATFGDMHGFNCDFKFPVPGSKLIIHALINFESQVACIEKILPGNQ